jgi:hypothetical protein
VATKETPQKTTAKAARARGPNMRGNIAKSRR